VVARSAAIAHGLDFVPLSEERFDLVFPKEWSGDPRAARMVETLEGRPFRRELGSRRIRHPPVRSPGHRDSVKLA